MLELRPPRRPLCLREPLRKQHKRPATDLGVVPLAHAGERLVDYAARESGRLRVARHGGKEDVNVAATLRRPRWRSEEEDEEQCGKRTLHRRPSFTIPFVPASGNP